MSLVGSVSSLDAPPLRYVEGEIPLATYAAGQGEPVLLIMGLACCAADWGPLRSQLAAHGRVVSFDNRGTGRSEAQLSDLSLEQMVADTLAVMDAYGIARANLVGYSMGGMVAQLLALSHPERVRRLALVSTHPGARSSTPPVSRAMQVLMQPNPDIDQMIRDQFLVFSAPDFPTEQPDRFEQMVAVRLAHRTPLQTVVLQLQAMQASERAEQLTSLQIPTLIVHGRQDTLVPFANGERLKSLLPLSQLHAFDGCGHMLPWEAPERTGQLLTQFFEL